MCINFILLFFQAQRKWVEEQEEFARRRKEHEIKMIEMEQVSKNLYIFYLRFFLKNIFNKNQI